MNLILQVQVRKWKRGLTQYPVFETPHLKWKLQLPLHYFNLKNGLPVDYIIYNASLMIRNQQEKVFKLKAL